MKGMKLLVPLAILLALALVFTTGACGTGADSFAGPLFSGDYFYVSFAGDNDPSEPLMESFSLDDAVAFLDESSLTWEQDRACVTCHTNGLALAAQPVIAPKSAELAQGRAFASDLMTSTQFPAGQILCFPPLPG